MLDDRINSFDRYCMRAFGAFNKNRLGTGRTLTEVAVLNEIAMHPGVNANKVATFLGIDSGYMTRLVKSMDADGLIVRTNSDDDHRVKCMTLTEKGRRMNADDAAEARMRNGALLDGLSADEVEEVLASMKRIEMLLAPNVPIEIED